jgi:tetratricopeptide (TPR) repeat protein
VKVTGTGIFCVSDTETVSAILWVSAMASNPLARALKARGKKIPGGEDTNQLPGERANFFYNRAKLLYKEGGNCSIILERVTATIIKAIGLSPLEIKYFLFLAKVFHAALDFASCVYCLRYVLKVSPHHLVARKRLSIVLFQMGQESLCEALVAKNRGKPLFTKAKAYFEECMKHDVLNKRLWILKSICHIYLNELDQAYEAVKRVIRPNKPVPAELYILRAKILWAQGLTAQGNQDLTIAKTIDPRHPEVAAFSTRIFIESEKLFHRCLDFIEEGDYGSALKAVKHAMSIARDDIKLHCLVAKIYRLSGDVQAAFAAIQQATTMFRQATSSDVFDMDLPDDIVLQTNLIFNDMAIGFAQQGDYQRSIALLNKIIESERERCARKAAQAMDVRYLINRADCYRAIGRSVDAVRDYSEALSVKPNDVQVKTRLSLTLYTEAVEAFNRSDFSTCEKLFCDAIELNANVSEYYLNRGKARYYLGKLSCSSCPCYFSLFNGCLAEFKSNVVVYLYF